MSQMITVANMITLSRIVCTIFFIVAMITNYTFFGIMFFLIAALSDFFDGYIARLYKEETALGAMLDPLADKFLLISSVIILFLRQNITIIPWWFLLLLITKETIQIIGGGFLWYRFGIHALLRPSMLAKITTASLLIFIVFALFSPFDSFSIDFFSFLLLCNSLLLIGSFTHYIALFIKILYLK